MKTCIKCGESKPLSEFYKNIVNRDGKHHRCKKCMIDYQGTRHYRVKYNMTREDRQNLIDQQNGQCAICGYFFKSEKHTHIDHCHTTGKIRGILCSYCNVALGLLKDSPEILENAIKYLKKV
jgi:hypothetical protein